MHKRVFLSRIILIFSLIMILGLGWSNPANAFSEEQKLVLQSWRIVNQSYLDDTFNGQNWWLLRERFLRRGLGDRESTYQAIEEMLASLGDPFTRLLRPEQYRSLKVNTSGELSGVGLQIDLAPDTHQLEVVAPIAGSPAEKAGVKAGDLILAIDNVPTGTMPLDEAANRMRGKIGTKVILTIQRPPNKDQQAVELVRDRIALNPVFYRLDTSVPSLPVGYVRLSQFSANATTEVTQAVKNLDQKGTKGYILDLRNNPGGLLQAGIEIARLWLNDSTIVYTVNRQGMLGNFEAEHSALTDAPLVVLVNQGTASASEILAGALQDNQRGLLVGEKTFGKGLIQSLFELPDNAGLAVTVAKYETPNHHDIHKLGIVPDRVVPQDPIAWEEMGTESDRQYQVALELLRNHQIREDAA